MSNNIISNPDHYCKDGSVIEPIALIQDRNYSFCIGNTLKYLIRHKYKGTATQDLQKAMQYLEFEENPKNDKNKIIDYDKFVNDHKLTDLEHDILIALDVYHVTKDKSLLKQARYDIIKLIKQINNKKY